MVTVREARPEDAPALAALLAELGYPAAVQAVAARSRAFADESGRASVLLVAEDEEGLPGLASASVIPLLHQDGDWCRISALVVADGRRRSGIGRALVTEIEERARDRGCRYLEVTSGERSERKAAHAFYRALGLEEVSRRYLKEL